MAGTFRAQRRYPSPTNATGYPEPPVEYDPTIGRFDGIPHAYEVDTVGHSWSWTSAAAWERGAMYRAVDPLLSGYRFPPPVPAYDPTIGPDYYEAVLPDVPKLPGGSKIAPSWRQKGW